MSGPLAESVLLALVFSLIGYRMSVRHHRVRGVTPWRLPSLVWALICLVFQFLGVFLELLAELTTRTQVPITPARASDELAPYGGGLDAGTDRPGTVARPVTTGTEVPAAQDLEETERPADVLAPPLSDQPGRAPLFGWYPDPLGRHEMRYFDGRVWGELVLDGRATSIDPPLTTN
ncbi:MAG: hypothetical protein JWM85_1360 [Acidimicrobiaceae bacterium]|nr:hypothetical protein [Acidimicrobiaceae bacterium]